MRDFDGRTCVVTGAGGGLGQALCRQIAERGGHIIAVGRTMERLEAAADIARRSGGTVQMVAGDITHGETIARVKHASAASGGVDVLVNNAAVGYSYEQEKPGSMAALDGQSPELWRDVINVNLNGPAAMTQALIPDLLRKGAGASIVFISSVLGLRGHPNAHAYGAAKAAINNLVQSLAVTYGPAGIRTNGVAPGLIATPMVASIIARQAQGDDADRFAFCPLGRAAQPDEVARAVLFLASPSASYVNGAILTVDGGTSAKV